MATALRAVEAPVRAFVGVGANLGDPVAQVHAAMDALGTLTATRRVACSRLFSSRPMGPVDQPDYVNAVVALDTSLDPHALLVELQAVERRQGRVRDGERWGPRTLDLDLLVYGDVICRDAVLQLPHPGIAERDFVLLPLADIAPSLEIPGLGPLEHLISRLPSGSGFVVQ